MAKNITIMIPTYNRLEYLKKAIKSICSQSCNDFNLILVNNCSNDGTKNYLRFLKQELTELEFHVINQDKTIWAVDNWKCGFDCIQTEYFYMLGDDDYLGIDFIKTFNDYLKRFHDADIVSFNYTRVDENGRVIDKKGPCKNGLVKRDEFARMCLSHQVFFGSSVFRTKKLSKFWQMGSSHFDFDYMVLNYLSLDGGKWVCVNDFEQVFITLHSQSATSAISNKINDITFNSLKGFVSYRNSLSYCSRDGANYITEYDINNEIGNWLILGSRKERDANYWRSIKKAFLAGIYLKFNLSSVRNIIKSLIGIGK